MSVIQFSPYSPYVFPTGRSPGFDPTHPLARGCTPNHGISAVPSGANFINLLNGSAGTPNTGTGTYGNAIYGPVGPAVTFSAVNACYISFSGQAQVVDQNVTCALIFYSTQVYAANSYIFETSLDSGADGFGLRFSSNGATSGFSGGFIGKGSFASTTFTVPDLTPIYVAFSRNATLWNCVAVNLLTGQTYSQSGTVSSTTPGANTGTYYIGNGTSTNVSKGISAWMYAPTFNSLQTLLLTAQSPWDFWYPSQIDDYLFDLEVDVGATSGNTYSISASEGTYTLTGQSQTVNAFRSIIASEGAYSLTGKSQTLGHGYNFSASEGSYSLTGEPQTMKRGINISAAEGTYSLTGKPQVLGVGLPAVQGTYSLSGKPQSFQVALSALAAEGTYSVTGYPQTLTKTSVSGGPGQSQGHKFIADVGQMTEANF